MEKEIELKDYERFLHKYVKKYHKNVGYLSYEDFYQEACLVFLNCSKNFNPDLGYRFTTYLGKALDLHFSKVIVKIYPLSLSHGYFRKKKEVEKLREEGYSDNEIREKLKLKFNDYNPFYLNSCVSLDEVVAEEGGMTIADLIGDENSEECFRNIELVEDILERVESRFGGKKKVGIYKEYIKGVYLGSRSSYEEIADKFGVSRQYVGSCICSINKYLRQFKEELL